MKITIAHTGAMMQEQRSFIVMIKKYLSVVKQVIRVADIILMLFQLMIIKKENVHDTSR